MTFPKTPRHSTGTRLERKDSCEEERPRRVEWGLRTSGSGVTGCGSRNDSETQVKKGERDRVTGVEGRQTGQRDVEKVSVCVFK